MTKPHSFCVNHHRQTRDPILAQDELSKAAYRAGRSVLHVAGTELAETRQDLDEAWEHARRNQNDVGRLRALMQEDDHRAWVAMGHPENTRTTNVVMICERFAELVKERDALLVELALAQQRAGGGTS